MSSKPLSITIRFGGQPLPDVALTTTTTTTIAGLKHQIRARMPVSYAEHGIKLIYNGRQLTNQVSLGRELGLGNGAASAGGAPRVWYVHCALPLASDQSWETAEAKRTFGDPTISGWEDDEEIPFAEALQDQAGTSAGHESTTVTAVSTPASTLRGFDRLRSVQSFEIADIASMRTQFRANISARHTPATMPSELQLLQMEDRWLDNSAFSSSLASVGNIGATHGTSSTQMGPQGSNAEADTTEIGTAGQPSTDAAEDLQTGQQLTAPVAAELEAEDDASRALDDTLLGVLTGFFWPIGAVVWGLREEGVWSRRRGWSVLAGAMVNLGFGMVRLLG